MTRRSRLGPAVLLLICAVVFAGLPGGGFTSAVLSDGESVGVSFQGATEAGNTGAPVSAMTETTTGEGSSATATPAASATPAETATASETGSPTLTSTPAPDETSTTPESSSPTETSSTETEEPGSTTPTSTEPKTESTDTETPTAATETEDG